MPEHDPPAERPSSWTLELEKGTAVLENRSNDLLAHPELSAAYLGDSSTVTPAAYAVLYPFR